MDNPHINSLLAKLDDLFSASGIGSLADFAWALQMQALVKALSILLALVILLALLYGCWRIIKNSVEASRAYDADRTGRVEKPLIYDEGIIPFMILSAILAVVAIITTICLLDFDMWMKVFSRDYALLQFVAGRLGK